jgi:hypothetical protein
MGQRRRRGDWASSDRYVVMQHPGEDETKIPIKSYLECDHITTICATYKCMEEWDKVMEVFYDRTVGGRKLTIAADQPKKRRWSEDLKGYTYNGWELSACQCHSWLRCKCKPGSKGFEEREKARTR